MRSLHKQRICSPLSRSSPAHTPLPPTARSVCHVSQYCNSLKEISRLCQSLLISTSNLCLQKRKAFHFGHVGFEKPLGYSSSSLVQVRQPFKIEAWTLAHKFDDRETAQRSDSQIRGKSPWLLRHCMEWDVPDESKGNATSMVFRTEIYWIESWLWVDWRKKKKKKKKKEWEAIAKSIRKPRREFYNSTNSYAFYASFIVKTLLFHPVQIPPLLEPFLVLAKQPDPSPRLHKFLLPLVLCKIWPTHKFLISTVTALNTTCLVLHLGVFLPH